MTEEYIKNNLTIADVKSLIFMFDSYFFHYISFEVIVINCMNFLNETLSIIIPVWLVFLSSYFSCSKSLKLCEVLSSSIVNYYNK